MEKLEQFKKDLEKYNLDSKLIQDERDELKRQRQRLEDQSVWARQTRAQLEKMVEELDQREKALVKLEQDLRCRRERYEDNLKQFSIAKEEFKNSEREIQKLQMRLEKDRHRVWEEEKKNQQLYMEYETEKLNFAKEKTKLEASWDEYNKEIKSIDGRRKFIEEENERLEIKSKQLREFQLTVKRQEEDFRARKIQLDTEWERFHKSQSSLEFRLKAAEQYLIIADEVKKDKKQLEELHIGHKKAIELQAIKEADLQNKISEYKLDKKSLDEEKAQLNYLRESLRVQESDMTYVTQKYEKEQLEIKEKSLALARQEAEIVKEMELIDEHKEELARVQMLIDAEAEAALEKEELANEREKELMKREELLTTREEALTKREDVLKSELEKTTKRNQEFLKFTAVFDG